MTRSCTILLATALLLAPTSPIPAVGVEDPPIDQTLPEYRPEGRPSGKVTSIGSSTATALLERLAEAFRQVQPEVAFDFDTGGSASAPPALAAGQSQMAPMSRPMTDAEVADVKARRGAAPVNLRIAVDALGFFVHPDNPIDALDRAQLKSVFGDATGGPTTWGELGATGDDWATRGIVRFIPRSSQGSFGVMRSDLLGGGRYHVDAVPGTVASELIQGVVADPRGITFVSLFFRTPRAKLIGVRDEAGVVVRPTPEDCASGRYPFARHLHLYVVPSAGGVAPPALAEFIRFVYSRQGQTIVAREGFTPVSATLAAEAMKSLGIAR